MKQLSMIQSAGKARASEEPSTVVNLDESTLAQLCRRIENEEAVQRLAEQLTAAIEREDSEALVSLFTTSTTALAQQLQHLSITSAESAVSSGVFALQRVNRPDAWRDLLMRHVSAQLSERSGDAVAASKAENDALHAFERLFRDDNALWLVPLLFALAAALHARARRADAVLRAGGKKASQQEEAARVLNDLFRACMMDRTPQFEASKKRSAVRLSTVLFRIYFDLNTLGLCKNLVSIVEGPGFGALDRFPLGQVVTYRYFVGKLDLFQGDLRRAQQALRFAFRHTPPAHVRNRRLVLTYLVPVELLLGRAPRPALLARYGLEALVELCAAVVRGDIARFEAALSERQDWLIARGIYLTCEQLRPLLHRNLLKRIHVLLGKPEQLRLALVQGVLTALTGREMALDEVECLVANLIYQGQLKGYLSHKHRVAVLSKANPFPKLTANAAR